MLNGSTLHNGRIIFTTSVPSTAPCDAGGELAQLPYLSNLTANTYTITASPTRAQALDTECGQFTLDHLGTRGNTGSTTAPINRCWQR